MIVVHYYAIKRMLLVWGQSISDNNVQQDIAVLKGEV
jgi:hypothetical protein